MAPDTRARRRALTSVAVLAALAWAGGCLDVTGPRQVRSSLLVVSDTASRALPAASGAAVSLSTSSETDVAYISLAPGTASDGELATIKNLSTGTTLTVPVAGGGFDPVAVGASVGNTIELVVRDAAGTVVLQAQTMVAASRRPIVVRTDPPPRKRDVPLNTTIIIVFSEPIEPATLNDASVRLLTGAMPITGRLEFRDEAHLTAALVPATPLAGGTTYTLTVTDEIRDLDGEALEAPVTVVFTTTEVSPPLGTLSQIAFWSGGISVMNADGSSVRRLTTQAADYEPAWSPDGMKLAFTRQGDGSEHDIYVINADGTGLRRLTAGPSHDYSPTWSPDGTRIAYQGDGYIHVVNAADGTGAIRLAPGGCCSDMGPSWSPDGSKIAFDREDGASSDIYVMNADGSGVRRLTSDSAREISPSWSPDGTRIAFQRGSDIYVMNASDGSGATKLASMGEGFGGPSWSPDGRMIAFGGYGGIAIMNADGSHLRLLTGGTSPAWSRVGAMPPPPALSIEKVLGDLQVDTVLATLAAPLRVRVLQNGAPAPGVVVSWAVADDWNSRGGSASASTSITDAAGIASVTWTLSPVAGEQMLRARVSSFGGSPVAAFTAKANAGTPVTLCCGYAFGVGLVNSTLDYYVNVRDASGNYVAGVPITWVVTSGGGSISPTQDTTRSMWTSNDAYSRATHMLGSNDGTEVVTATALTAPRAPQVTFVTRAVTTIVHLPDYGGDPFVPDSVAVPSGRTVAWVWWDNSEDSPDHNVTFEDGIASPTQGHHGDPWVRTFTDAPQTFRYRCTLHGEIGVVTVQ